MEGQTNCDHKLICITCNCEYADNVRLPYLQSLFKQCDFVFTRTWFVQVTIWMVDKIGNGVGKHGVSAMKERKLLHGCPNGGAAIIWNKNLKTKVVPVEH